MLLLEQIQMNVRRSRRWTQIVADKNRFLIRAHPRLSAALLLLLAFNRKPLLEVQLQTELKLSRVEGGRRAAVVTSAAIAFSEGICIREERRRGRFVKAIKEIKAFCDHFQVKTLAEADVAREAQVNRGVAVRDAAIARKVSAL